MKFISLLLLITTIIACTPEREKEKARKLDHNSSGEVYGQSNKSDDTVVEVAPLNEGLFEKQQVAMDIILNNIMNDFKELEEWRVKAVDGYIERVRGSVSKDELGGPRAMYNIFQKKIQSSEKYSDYAKSYKEQYTRSEFLNHFEVGLQSAEEIEVSKEIKEIIFRTGEVVTYLRFGANGVGYEVYEFNLFRGYYTHEVY